MPNPSKRRQNPQRHPAGPIYSHTTGRSSLLISSFLLIIGLALGLNGNCVRVLCMMVIIVIACVLSAIM